MGTVAAHIRYSGCRICTLNVVCGAGRCLVRSHVFCACAGENFDGAEALAFTGHAVAFGARPDGSAAIGKLRMYITRNWPRAAVK